jgi:hypothetical protein
MLGSGPPETLPFGRDIIDCGILFVFGSWTIEITLRIEKGRRDL